MPRSARPLPPLDLLVGFEAAARHLSFTRAAEELFLTQSAVSRQILQLEDYLGQPLFERHHKALALTEAGASYHRTVANVLDQLRESTRKLRDARTGHRLTVTTTISFASMWLVPRLARFQKEHPEVDVRISATATVVDLEREGIDLAIRDCPRNAVPAGAIELVSDHVAPVCSPAFLRAARAAKRPLAKPADLCRHVLLHLHDPAGQYPFISWSSWLESAGLSDLEPAGTLVFGHYNLVVQAAELGQGVALGRLSLLTEQLRTKSLVTLFGGGKQIGRAFYALHARGRAAVPEARKFVEWVEREIGRDR